MNEETGSFLLPRATTVYTLQAKKNVNNVSHKLEVTVPCTNTKQQQQQHRQLHKKKRDKDSVS